MNTRQIHIFFNFSKALQQLVWLFVCCCKNCEPEIVFVLICTLAEQFHVRKSYKTRELTLVCIGNLEENIDLSRIDLAVPELKIQQTHLTPMYRNAPLQKM